MTARPFILPHNRPSVRDREYLSANRPELSRKPGTLLARKEISVVSEVEERTDESARPRSPLAADFPYPRFDRPGDSVEGAEITVRRKASTEAIVRR